jgi:hypothetical protein
MKSFFIPVMAMIALTTAFPQAHSNLDSRETCSAAGADNLVFTVSMSTFTAARNAQSPSCYVWKSDDCSASPDRPDGYDFVPSCRRHDFGYRNAKKQGRFTEDLRKRIDDNFKNDLYNYCKQFHGWESWKGVECRRIADIYHAFVRACGGGGCLKKREEMGGEDVERVAAMVEARMTAGEV